MELELVDKYYKRTLKQLNYPNPPSLYKSDHKSVTRQLYPIQIGEEVLQNIKHGFISSQSIKDAFYDIINTYNDTMARTWADCGKIEGVYLKLDLKPGAVPFKYAPYKTAFTQMDEIEDQVTKLLEAKFISPSKSSFASPVLMVPKKKIGDQIEWRMCIDYRRLNSMTIKDRYPLPNIQSLYRKFAGNKIFSSLDLRHAHHDSRSVLNTDTKQLLWVSSNGITRRLVL